MSTVLITGGAKRIGAEVAKYLAQRGYNIALHYNKSQQAAESLAKVIRTFGVQCELFTSELNGTEACAKSLIEDVCQKMPDLEVLINNASIFNEATILQTTEDTISNNFSLHFNTPLFLSKYFYLKVGKGNIINMIDSYIATNVFRYSTYLASKKSLAALTKQSACEFAPKVRVNGVAPGLILPANESEESLKKIVNKIPLQRIGSCQDIAKTVEFLISSSYITGEIINVDGGRNLK